MSAATLPVVGFSTNVWDNPADIVGHLEFLAGHFRHLEFEIAEEAQEVLFSATPDEYDTIVTGLRDVMERHQLDLSVHAAWWGPDTDILAHNADARDRSVALLKRAVDLAAEIGVDKVTYHPGLRWDRPSRQLVDLIRIPLEELVAYAGRRGVTLCLENMGADRPRYATFDAGELEYICTSTGTALTLDIIHLASLAPDRSQYLESLEQLAPYTVTAHIADMVGNKHAHLPIGEGDLALAESLEVLGLHGFGGTAVVEEFVKRYPPETYLKAALDFRQMWVDTHSGPTG